MGNLMRSQDKGTRKIRVLEKDTSHMLGRKEDVEATLNDLESDIPQLKDNGSTTSHLSKRLEQLQTLQEQIKKQEDEAYILLGVENITELQNKITTLYESGLNSLSGRVSYAKLSELLTDEESNREMAEKQLIDFLNQHVTEIVKINVENKHNELQNQIAAFLKQQFQNKGRKGRLIFSRSNQAVGVGKLIQGMSLSYKDNNRELNESIKFDRKSIANSKVATSTYVNLRMLLKGQIDGKSVTEQNKDIYFGWRNSPENNKKAIDEYRTSILNFFLEQLHTDDPQLKASFTNAFEKFPTSALRVANKAQLQGVIGEIVMGTYVEYLLAESDKSASVLQTGAMKNLKLANNPQLGVDLVLNGIGFQVKNYSEEDVLDEQQNPIGQQVVVERNLSLSNLGSTLEIDNQIFMIFKKFYSLYNYNIKYTDEFEDTRARIENDENKIESMASFYLDKILRLEEDVESIINNDRLGKLNGQAFKGIYFKTFWLVSGRKLVPSSEILQKVIDMLSNYATKNILDNAEVDIQSHYSGDNILHHLSAKASDLTVSNVVAKTKLSFKYTFRL